MGFRIVNPILSGYYPNPTICIAEGKFYITTESSVFFPGFPLFMSKNSISWTQIGNIISRQEQIKNCTLKDKPFFESPTLRFNEGTFYCVCRNPSDNKIYLFSSQNPESEWSNPVAIEGASGKDPSLFFDEDGTCWLSLLVEHECDNEYFNLSTEVTVQRLDCAKIKLYGEKKITISAPSIFAPHRPHLFSYNDEYFIIFTAGIAEGIDNRHYAISVAKSDAIDGKWEACPLNPILTHRNLGKNCGLLATSNADIVRDKEKRWWSVCNGIRPFGEKNNRFTNMGQETFMIPAFWEDGWLLLTAETGKIENAYTLMGHSVPRDSEDADPVNVPLVEDFNSEVVDNYWIMPNSISGDFFNCNEKSGNLRIYGQNDFYSGKEVSFIARRQTGFSYECSTKIHVKFSDDKDCAGLCLYKSKENFFRFQVFLRGKVIVLQLIKVEKGNPEIITETVITGGTKTLSCVLKIVQEDQSLKFEYGPDVRSMELLSEKIDSTFLSNEKSGCPDGTVIGVFAVSGKPENKGSFYSDFDWFQYENLTRDWIEPLAAVKKQ